MRRDSIICTECKSRNLRRATWRMTDFRKLFSLRYRFAVAIVEHANTSAFFGPFALMLRRADADDRWEPRCDASSRALVGEYSLWLLGGPESSQGLAPTSDLAARKPLSFLSRPAGLQ